MYFDCFNQAFSERKKKKKKIDDLNEYELKGRK
jgi:hypothetical protein